MAYLTDKTDRVAYLTEKGQGGLLTEKAPDDVLTENGQGGY